MHHPAPGVHTTLNQCWLRIPLALNSTEVRKKSDGKRLTSDLLFPAKYFSTLLYMFNFRSSLSREAELENNFTKSCAITRLEFPLIFIFFFSELVPPKESEGYKSVVTHLIHGRDVI